MELVVGYKQTEVGVIPEDWIVAKIGSVANVQRGASPRPIDSPVWFSSQSTTGWLRISDVTKSNKYLLETTQKLSELGIANSRFVPRGNLVMSICATIGRPILICIDVCIHDGFVVFKELKVEKEYFYYILKDLERHWSKHGQTGSQMNLNTCLINSITISLSPKKAEQTAIANALSDADAWIQSLTQLIAKKCQIKQGVMQNLLKPKGDWVEKKLGDTAVLKARIGWQGLTTAEYLKDGDYYLVTGTDFKDGGIDWKNCHYVEKLRYKQDPYIQLRVNDILVTKDGTIGKVAFIDKIFKPATLNSGVFVIRPLDQAFNPLFFFYILSSNWFTEFLDQLSAGSTINHLYQKDFVNFTYKVPSRIEEQTKIATILSSIDYEIFTLETKLKKAKQIKQGMMQNLLTGRIRLI